MTDTDGFDPKGLIKEAFAIDGIGGPECRSIFLDWALGLPQDRDVRTEVTALLRNYAAQHRPDHPMSRTLQAALTTPDAPRRRGGRQGRASRS